MKKVLSLFLLFLIAFAAACPAQAAPLNYAAIDGREILEIESGDDGFTFVTSILGYIPVSHEGLLQDYPSYVWSDIIIDHYHESDSAAVWRFWVSYSASEHLNATSMTVILDGKEYCFSDIAFEGSLQEYDSNVRETLRIAFGYETMPFWLDLMLKYRSLENAMDLTGMNFTAILHGDRDVTLEIPGDALLDMAIIGDTYLSLAGMDALISYDGTGMETP